VSARETLIASIRGNAKNVRYTDACKVAGWLGFDAKAQKGSHAAYSKSGEADLLNFQNKNGMIKPYQVRQLIKMIDKYWTPDDDKARRRSRE
jgi:predicted RNA binding protein YcfA (HicA-like mRNA interferase family)